MSAITSAKSSDPEIFSEPMKAAWRWIDAIAAAGNSGVTHSEGLDGLDWSWDEIGEAIATYRDSQSHPRSEEAIYALEDWLNIARQDTDAKALLASRTSWCFDNSEFDPSSGPFLYLWPTDAPELEIEALDMPVPENMDNEMEGVWSLNLGAKDEAQAMQQVWEALQNQGYFFDERAQRNPRGTAYAYAMDDPDELWERLESSIPALRARKEALEIGSATGGRAALASKLGL